MLLGLIVLRVRAQLINALQHAQIHDLPVAIEIGDGMSVVDVDELVDVAVVIGVHLVFRLKRMQNVFQYLCVGILLWQVLNVECELTGFAMVLDIVVPVLDQSSLNDNLVNEGRREDEQEHEETKP